MSQILVKDLGLFNLKVRMGLFQASVRVSKSVKCLASHAITSLLSVFDWDWSKPYLCAVCLLGTGPALEMVAGAGWLLCCDLMKANSASSFFFCLLLPSNGWEMMRESSLDIVSFAFSFFRKAW